DGVYRLEGADGDAPAWVMTRVAPPSHALSSRHGVLSLTLHEGGVRAFTEPELELVAQLDGLHPGGAAADASTLVVETITAGSNGPSQMALLDLSAPDAGLSPGVAIAWAPPLY